MALIHAKSMQRTAHRVGGGRVCGVDRAWLLGSSCGRERVLRVLEIVGVRELPGLFNTCHEQCNADKSDTFTISGVVLGVATVLQTVAQLFCNVS